MKNKSFNTDEFNNTIYTDPQRYDDEYWWKKDDMEFWKTIYNMSKGNQVLELAAGTGRLATPLIREGANYTGLEISSKFCQQFDKNVSNDGNAQIIKGDMRNFNFDQTFDLIFIGFNSFLHLLTNNDAKACLECVIKHMHKTTIFAIDIFVPNPLFLYRPEIQIPIMDYKDSITGELITVNEICKYDVESEINKITWFYNSPSKKNDKIYSFNMRMYYPDTMNRLLIDAGLTIDKMIGNYNFSSFSEKSELQIYVCTL